MDSQSMYFKLNIYFFLSLFSLYLLFYKLAVVSLFFLERRARKRSVLSNIKQRKKKRKREST